MGCFCHAQSLQITPDRDLDRSDLADPRRVLQARDTSLVLAGHVDGMARRGDDGFWRHAISLLDLGPG
jgi:hypothetical protein